MPDSSGVSPSAAAAAGTSAGPGRPGRGHLSNHSGNGDANTSKYNRRVQKQQLPPMAKKSPAKRSPSASTSSSSSSTFSSTSSSSSSSTSPATNTTTTTTTDEQNVRVVARLRPLSAKELDENSKEAIKAGGGKASAGQVVVEGQRTFEYDAVFGPQTTQAQVYEKTAGDTVKKNIFRGFNVTILAYGQTGSGKTYSMGTAGCGGGGNNPSANGNGNGNSNDANSLIPPEDGDGIIGRAVYDLFKTRASLPGGKDRVKVEMSYLEIYNEEARDLMYSGTKPPELHIRDSKSEGIVVRNLSRHVVKSPTDVANLMQEASERRVTASTQMNAVSSRSHAVCTLYVTIAPPTTDAGDEGTAVGEDNDADITSNDDGEVSRAELTAKLTLVDLAGSERIKRTGAEGARMREGININKGLFVLGQVVSALSELGQHRNGSSSSSSSSSSNSHIPYRDSKLTRLLQDSLGGNSKTVMVACVSPAESNVEESVNTLRYAERARNITNNATRNVIDRSMSPSEAAALRRENQMLKLQLLQAQMANASAAGGATAAGMAVVGGGASALVGAVGGDESTGGTILKGINVEKLEITTRLRANITSMKTRVEQLEQRSVSSAEDALTASFKADKWRQRYESLVAAMAANGIDLPEEVRNACTVPSRKCGEDETLIAQLRRELYELKEVLRDSQTDAEVARATAAAVIAGDGDLSTAEHLALAGEEALAPGGCKNDNATTANDDDNVNDGGSSEDTSTKLSAELMAVDCEIDRKEELAAQMTAERKCMDQLKVHFESALHRLQDEVDVLSSERESLLQKVGGGVNGGNGGGKKRGPGGGNVSDRHDDDNNPERKRMQARIADLEERIKLLKKKSAEHTKSLRMREAAEKKCSQLAAEIAADKRRRAGLQKELKELSTQRRHEKKVAQQQATKMLRDSQKIKAELQKVKDQAARQNAVLRRKAAEAVSKQKQLEEKQKKRNAAAAMRQRNSVGLQRKEELANWLEKELGAAMTIQDIRDQIEEQTDLIQEATAKKKRHESTAAEQSIEIEIATRKSVIDQLDLQEQLVYKSVLGNNAKGSSAAAAASTPCFVDVSMWQGLTRQEMRALHANTFSRLVNVAREATGLRAKAKAAHKVAVTAAINEERQKADEAIMRLKMEHSKAIGTLLESTKESVQHQLRQDLTAIGIGDDGLDASTKASIDAMLESYLSSCERVGQTVKSDLDAVREKHDSMKAFVDQVARGIIAQNEASALVSKSAQKKKAKKKKPSPSPEEESDFDLFEDDDDDDAGAYEDSDDSDWSPDTPAPKKKKKKAIDISAERASLSDDDDEQKLAGESIIAPAAAVHVAFDGATAAAVPPEAAEMESLTVTELRSRLKEKNMAVSGRKAELIKRLRTTGSSIPSSTPPASATTKPATKENASPSIVNLPSSATTSMPVKKNSGTPNSYPSKASFSSSASSSSTPKERGGLSGRPPRKRPATSTQQHPTADILTASARKRRRKSMARAVEQMEVEMAKNPTD